MAVKLGINPGIPDLPTGLSEPDYALVAPLYRAFTTVASQLSYATGKFTIQASSIQDSDLFSGALEGSKIYPVSSGTISYGKLVNFYDNAGVLTMREADASAGITRPAHGILVQPNGVTLGKRGAVCISPALIPGITGAASGVIYFLGAAGIPTSTKPVAAGTIAQPIGFGLGSDKLWFDRSLFIQQN